MTKIDDESAEGSNTSDNQSLRDVIALSRRSVLENGLGAAAVAFLGAGVKTAAAQDKPELEMELDSAAAYARDPTLGFTAVPTSDADTLVVPPGYTAEVLIPWGQPLYSTGPAWKKDASNTAAEQEQQIGFNHDGMHYFPILGKGSQRGLLVLNHEYVDPILLYADGAAVMTQEKVDKALAAHGVTVIEIGLVNGKWQTMDGPYNRRITGNTPMTFSGPVSASHPALQSELGNTPKGTLNNCANGWTPWNTYLTCEENWNGYFGSTEAAWTPTAAEARYGVSGANTQYRWHTVDPRFDLSKNRKELNRFGWVVEIDPFAPTSTPIKRTALGRLKHENATFADGRGHAVIYTGDDENGDYFYKFVSAEKWRDLQKESFNSRTRRSPLDEGTLYVAKFFANGTGTWLPLVHGQGALTVANGWADQADVLIRTRQAADAMGATKMDRPEWCAVHPGSQNVYLTLTNGSGWEAPSSPNPRAPNTYGHILEMSHEGGDHTALTMRWNVFILGGDPAFDPSVHLDASNIFGSPDGLFFDRDGRMWIQTDISNGSQNRTNYVNIKNNMMLAADAGSSEIKRFLTGPRGAEITGIAMTPDQQTMFINVQHPGESTTAWGTPSPANPRAVSNWPDFDPEGRPRPCTIVIRKAGGGKIGT
jgi:uncharacterized protein